QLVTAFATFAISRWPLAKLYSLKQWTCGYELVHARISTVSEAAKALTTHQGNRRPSDLQSEGAPMSTVGTPKSPEQIQHDWDTNPRWKGTERSYTAADVVALQGSVVEESTLARRGAEVLWEQLHDMEWVNALGALTGNQAVQQVRAGLKAIYLSGWQVAGDANLSGHTYPDQSLYPANSVPQVVRRINNALLRADQIAKVEGDTSVENWLAPIVADGEAGFGGALNV